MCLYAAKIAVSPTANNYAELGVYSEAPQPIAPQPTPPVNSAYGEILSDSQIVRTRGVSSVLCLLMCVYADETSWRIVASKQRWQCAGAYGTARL